VSGAHLILQVYAYRYGLFISFITPLPLLLIHHFRLYHTLPPAPPPLSLLFSPPPLPTHRSIRIFLTPSPPLSPSFHILPSLPLRSFYKHVLGNPVDYTDLEAIEPEIFKSLKQILNLSLEDLGLELTFSAESHIFGKHEVMFHEPFFAE
jgi:hypothetical protein